MSSNIELISQSNKISDNGDHDKILSLEKTEKKLKGVAEILFGILVLSTAVFLMQTLITYSINFDATHIDCMPSKPALCFFSGAIGLVGIVLASRYIKDGISKL